MKDEKILIPDFKVEHDLTEKGYLRICGIDEAGRGAWAGPLISAAVILNSKKPIEGIDDSKRLKSSQRAQLAIIIQNDAIAYGVGLSSVQEINRYGVQTATYLSYKRAINKIKPSPDFLLIDHYRLPGTDTPQMSITHGDQTSLSIAAASILAKVARDSIMTSLSHDIPDYGFEKNFGYGTRLHQNAILKLGLSHNHRTAFVKKLFVKNRQEELFDN